MSLEEFNLESCPKAGDFDEDDREPATVPDAKGQRALPESS
jgi:hypothetical protein